MVGDCEGRAEFSHRAFLRLQSALHLPSHPISSLALTMAPQAASPYNEAGQSSSSELRFTFPVDKLEAYLLEKKLEGFVAPLKVEQFGMGQSNVG